MIRTVDDAASSRRGNGRASSSWPRVCAVIAVEIVLVAACTGEPTPSPQQAPSPADATPTAMAPTPTGPATTSSRAQTVAPPPTPGATLTPSPEPTVDEPVGSGYLTVAGRRGEVVGDCSLQGSPGTATSLSPRARLHLAVVAQPGEGDDAVHTAVVEPTDRGLRVRLEREQEGLDQERGRRQRAWSGRVDQARLGRVGDARVGTVSLNATLQPAPGAPSLPVTAATPTPQSTSTPGGPDASATEPRRPTAGPAPVPDTARPVRIALAVACRVTADVAE